MDQNEEFDDEDYYHKDNAQNQYEKFFSIDASIWEKYAAWFEQEGLTYDKNVWLIYPSYLNNSHVYYVGQNSQGGPIYKQKIVVDKLHTEYRLHIQSHSKHFLQQPHYYKGMFEILN